MAVLNGNSVNGTPTASFATVEGEGTNYIRGNKEITTLEPVNVVYNETAQVSAEDRAKIVPENIVDGVTILGVTGTAVGREVDTFSVYFEYPRHQIGYSPQTHVTCLLPKGALDTDGIVTDFNGMIDGLNQLYGLEIPAYTGLASMNDINQYIKNNAGDLRGLYYGAVLGLLPSYAISTTGIMTTQWRGLYNPTSLPVQIRGAFDNNTLTGYFEIVFLRVDTEAEDPTIVYERHDNVNSEISLWFEINGVVEETQPE